MTVARAKKVSIHWILYHWCKPVKLFEGQWVNSNPIYSLAQVKSEISQMRKLGWTDFRLTKHTIEEIDLPED